MSTTPRGTLDIPEGPHRIQPTAREDLDAALATLRMQAPAWTQLDLTGRIELLEELIDTTFAAAPDWCVAAAEAKGIRRDSPLMGEDWLNGPVVVLRNLQLLAATLRDIRATGQPQPPSLEVAPNGQVVATVVPTDPLYDRVVLPGFTAEVRLLPDVSLDQATADLGRIYRPGYEPWPQVSLVLGAGNLSSIPAMDVLYELFARDRVVILKMNPVNEHLGPHLAAALEPLVREGFLRIVYGGADEGRYLSDHVDVDSIHITGSNRTHDAIVFGTGEDGERRKQAGEPRLDKPITSELGNVTPVIVVPGPWSDRDLAFHGDNIASMVVNNAGFNCAAGRMIVQHRQWAKRKALVDAVRGSLRAAEQREPYYPGAVDRWRRFIEAHRSAEWYGEEGEGRVPFTLIPDLDPTDVDDIAFGTEAFCGVLGEVALDTPRSVPEFLDAAVGFCNDTLWGTLAATIIVHPRSLDDPEIAAAVERAIDQLRYGTVVINHWSGVAYGLVSTPWGAYPGAELTDIQSGRGVVHNSFLLEHVEKSVVRGPFRMPITPTWFHTHRTTHELAPKLARLYATRDAKLLPGLIWSAVRG